MPYLPELSDRCVERWGRQVLPAQSMCRLSTVSACMIGDESSELRA